MIKRILITGGSGLFAVNCAIQLRNSHEIVLGLHKRAVAIRGVDARQIAINSVNAALQTISEIAPDCVIHTAGATNVELCEADPELAAHANVDLAKNVALACARHNTALVHISTDHLFSGHTLLASEATPALPMNVYGASKCEAEKQVLAAHPESLVIRTNFYGWGTLYRQSFSDGILNALRAGKALGLFADVFFTPVNIESLVGAIMELVASGRRGVFNIAGDDRLSKYEFGVLLARAFGLDPELLRQTNSSDRADLVMRPRDMSLSNMKITQALGRAIGGIGAHFSQLQRQEISGVREELLSL